MKYIRNIYLFFFWQLLLTLLFWSTNSSSGNGDAVRKIQIERWDRREREREREKEREIEKERKREREMGRKEIGIETVTTRERERDREQKKKARNWRMQNYTNGKTSAMRHTSLAIPYLIMLNSFSVNESCVFHLPRFFPSKIQQVVSSFDTLFPPSASRTGGHSTRSEVLTCLYNMMCPWCWHASILSLVLRVEALMKHRSVII